MALTPQQIAQKWSQRLSSSGDQMKSGAMGVTESPTAKAARNLNKYVQNTQAAVASGRMAAALNGVTLQSWQSDYIAKGIPRIALGAQQGQSKVAEFQTQWAPLMAQVSQQAASMPNNSIDDGLAKVRLVMQAGKDFKNRRI